MNASILVKLSHIWGPIWITIWVCGSTGSAVLIHWTGCMMQNAVSYCVYTVCELRMLFSAHGCTWPLVGSDLDTVYVCGNNNGDVGLLHVTRELNHWDIYNKILLILQIESWISERKASYLKWNRLSFLIPQYLCIILDWNS